jgi:hypothetical protein
LKINLILSYHIIIISNNGQLNINLILIIILNNLIIIEERSASRERSTSKNRKRYYGENNNQALEIENNSILDYNEKDKAASQHAEDYTNPEDISQEVLKDLAFK